MRHEGKRIRRKVGTKTAAKAIYERLKTEAGEEMDLSDRPGGGDGEGQSLLEPSGNEREEICRRVDRADRRQED
jgi:hypothetical protein